MFLWRRRAIRAALERYTGLLQSLEPVCRTPNLLERRTTAIKPISIDHAVMEAAARDGRVVMASMDVGWSDIGSWTALLGAIGVAGTGDRRPGRRDRPDDDPGTWWYAGATAGSVSSRSTRAVA